MNSDEIGFCPENYSHKSGTEKLTVLEYRDFLRKYINDTQKTSKIKQILLLKLHCFHIYFKSIRNILEAVKQFNSSQKK